MKFGIIEMFGSKKRVHCLKFHFFKSKCRDYEHTRKDNEREC